MSSGFFMKYDRNPDPHRPVPMNLAVRAVFSRARPFGRSSGQCAAFGGHEKVVTLQRLRLILSGKQDISNGRGKVGCTGFQTPIQPEKFHSALQAEAEPSRA